VPVIAPGRALTVPAQPETAVPGPTLKVQGRLLDLDDLRQWADQLGLSDLVEQLLEQASTAELDGLE
jgi:hypothetical protein